MRLGEFPEENTKRIRILKMAEIRKIAERNAERKHILKMKELAAQRGTQRKRIPGEG